MCRNTCTDSMDRTLFWTPFLKLWAICRLERFQVFDQILLLLVRQMQAEKRIVMLDHIMKRGKPAVVVKAAFCVRPEASQGRCSIPLIRCAIGLEVVNADLTGLMHIPPGLRK